MPTACLALYLHTKNDRNIEPHFGRSLKDLHRTSHLARFKALEEAQLSQALSLYQ